MGKMASHPRNTVAWIPIVRQAVLSSYTISKLNTIMGQRQFFLDCKVEILDTEGSFMAKPISETNNSASLHAVHCGKERSVK